MRVPWPWVTASSWTSLLCVLLVFVRGSMDGARKVYKRDLLKRTAALSRRMFLGSAAAVTASAAQTSLGRHDNNPGWQRSRQECSVSSLRKLPFSAKPHVRKWHIALNDESCSSRGLARSPPQRPVAGPPLVSAGTIATGPADKGSGVGKTE